MVITKNKSLTLRIDPFIKEGLNLLAKKEHRSLTNMVEVMILDYCMIHNIALNDKFTLIDNANRQ